jgi:hypothetical protein
MKEFFMKNLIKWFGIIAFVAIIGFSFVSCGSMGEAFANSLNTTTETQKDELDGTTWKCVIPPSEGSLGTTFILVFKTPNFTITNENTKEVSAKGTYSISGNDVSMKFPTATQAATLSGDKKTLSYGTLVYTKQ